MAAHLCARTCTIWVCPAGRAMGEPTVPLPASHVHACGALRSHRRWWRQARPRSEIRGQPASESSCSESASWWRRLRHQSSTWGQRCSHRDRSPFRTTVGAKAGGAEGPSGAHLRREGTEPCPSPAPIHSQMLSRPW